MKLTSVADSKHHPEEKYYVEPEEINIAADPIIQYMNVDQLKRTIEETQKRMAKAAKELDFMEAARLRDEMFALQKKLN